MSGRGSCLYTCSWCAARMLCLGRSINMQRGEFVMITIVGDVVDRGYEWRWTRGRKYGIVVEIYFWKEEENKKLFSMIIICIHSVSVMIIIIGDVIDRKMNVWIKMFIERYMNSLLSIKGFLKYLNYCYLVIVFDKNLD